jgi:hypothetical protein
MAKREDAAQRVHEYLLRLETKVSLYRHHFTKRTTGVLSRDDGLEGQRPIPD